MFKCLEVQLKKQDLFFFVSGLTFILMIVKDGAYKYQSIFARLMTMRKK